MESRVTMILEIEGRKVDIDSGFAKLSPEEQNAQVEQIAKSLGPAKQTPEDTEHAKSSAGVNTVMGGVLGAGSGAILRKGMNPLGGLIQDPATGKWMAVENYARQMAQGKNYGGANYNQVWDKIRAVNADPTKGPIFEAEALKNAPMGSKVASKVPSAVRPMLTAPLGMIGRSIGGLGAGLQTSDAINRFNQNDTTGGVISGLGAIGTAASMIPHPVPRIVGTAVGLGAEALNAFLDSLKNKPQ